VQVSVTDDRVRCSLLLDPVRLEDTDFVIPLIKLKYKDTIVLKRDMKAVDNNLNSSGHRTIPKGTKLYAEDKWGTSRGHYFFKIDGESWHINDFNVPHPESLPWMMPDDVEVISYNEAST